MTIKLPKTLKALTGVFLVMLCLELPMPGNSTLEALAANDTKPATPPITTRNELVQAYVNPFEIRQSIDGFGGSITWYNNWLTGNPNSAEVYNLLFNEAGLDILRIKSNYSYSQPGVPKGISDDIKVVAGADKAAGKKVTILMSSWSPAAYLKSNNRIEGDGTLKKGPDGKYMYRELGQYFYDAVKAYTDQGIPIDYLSIQNELDFKASYDGCLFTPTETQAQAGYDQSFHAVYEKVKTLPNAPKMLGPESMNVDFTVLKKYLDPIMAKDPHQLYGIAHHLYAGGTADNPDTYVKSMRKLRDAYPNLPKWQTEFYRGDAVQTAWVINNTMVEEEANAYLVWDLVWSETGSIIAMGNPYNRASWKNTKGYEVTDKYYALKHYKFVDPGFKRIDSSVDPEANDIRMSAYTSPNQDILTIVLINTKYANSKVKLNLNGYAFTSSEFFLSNFQPGATDRFAAKGSLPADQIVNMPAQSIVTILFKGHPGKKPAVVQRAAAAAQPVKNNSAVAVYGTPVIDGEMDPIWKNAPEITPDVIAHGDHGASAKFRTLWDKNNLYIYAEITDKNPDVASQKVYEQDSVEFFVNENGKKPDEYGAGDGQYRVNLNNVQSYGGCASKDNFITAVKKTATGYIVEAAISFKTIKGAADRTIGFDFQINDAQGDGQRDWILKWSDPSNETYHNLEDIGQVKLSAGQGTEKSK